MRRAMYYTCPNCGANLDAGEKCDCKDRAEEKLKKSVLHMEVEPRTGQLRMILGRENEAITVV
ncbi:MAG: hypothetical protein NC548_55790 [Lachnospiraceae bacterium]|nr:hypothetical protein [Lachnospiraceae bacterium]